MIKRIVLGTIVFIAVAMGVLYLVNGKDNYDPTKYEVTATNGIQPGSKLTLTLPDQFDVSHSLNDTTKKMIFVFAKDTGHTVKEFLKQQGKGFLEARHALFVADISPMPVLVRNTFALPDLKKSDYAVLLIYDGTISEALKNGAETDKIAIASLDQGVITSIKFIATAEELKNELH